MQPLTLLLPFLALAAHSARASPCLAFDVDFNLLVLGLGGKDYNAGTRDSWTGSTQAQDITAANRPPFDGSNTSCYLAQFFNAVYVMNGDKSDPNAMYIYNAASKSWSKQETTANGFDPTNAVSILDHDTNVFYSMSGGQLWSADFGELKAAQGNAIAWQNVGNPTSFTANNYQPVMALASNHIHFLGIPSVAAGSADIFVIHFSFWQPQSQAYPTSGGKSAFPDTHGQATSLFQPQDVQQEFAFIPDDNSATYVVNVLTNTTQALAAPSTKSSSAIYFAGIDSIVQLDNASGQVSFLPYKQGDNNANAAAQWTKVSVLPAVAGSASPSGVSGSASPSGAVATNSRMTAGAGGTSQTSAGSGASATQNANGALRASSLPLFSLLTPLLAFVLVL